MLKEQVTKQIESEGLPSEELIAELLTSRRRIPKDKIMDFQKEMLDHIKGKGSDDVPGLEEKYGLDALESSMFYHILFGSTPIRERVLRESRYLLLITPGKGRMVSKKIGLKLSLKI